MGIDITEQERNHKGESSLCIDLFSQPDEASLDPLVTISAEGKITDVNEATVKVTGVAREQLIGTDFSNYFTEPQKAEDGYQLVFTMGFVKDYPLTIRHRDGRLINVLYNATVYRIPVVILPVYLQRHAILQKRKLQKPSWKDIASTRRAC